MNEEIACIKKDVKEFLSKNKIKYTIFSQLQDYLDHLSEDSYPEIIQYIQTHLDIIFKDESNAIFFFFNIIRTSEYHFKKFELYLDIFITFSNEFKKLNIDESKLLIISIRFPNSISYLFSKNFFSIETIISQSNNDMLLFSLFMPEIKAFDPEYALLIENNILSKGELEFYNFVKSNPEKHLLYRQMNYHPSSLHKSIRDDDIEMFQSLLSKNNIGINHVIEHSYYERALTVDDDLSLIQIAAVYGSIKIFKFLMMQDGIIINENLLNYAYYGNNHEIIHLCENVCPKKKVYMQPIRIHQTELLEYFIENFSHEFEEKDNVKNLLTLFDEASKDKAEEEEEEGNLYKCLNYESLSAAVFSFNFPIIKQNLSKIVFLAKYLDHSDRSFCLGEDCLVINSDYDYDLFKFLYLQKNSTKNKLPNDCYSFILKNLILDSATEQIKLVFQDIKYDIDLYYIFTVCIRFNSDFANYMLDLQFDELENKNEEPYIFNKIVEKIDINDLFIAIEIYNEEIVVKMIKLYGFLKTKENIDCFYNGMKKYITSKMISSLIQRLSRFLSNDIMNYFSSLL